MSAKKIISFLIASSTLLVASLIITFTIIMPQKTVTHPEQIKTYAFCFNQENDSSINKISDTRLKLSKNIEFKPNKTASWSDEFLIFKGATITEGVEYRNTNMRDYVCAIPFTIFNNYGRTIEFKLNVETFGDQELMQSIEYKVYDFCDSKYKTIEEINCVSGNGKYSHTQLPYNELQTLQTSHFCLVAIVNENCNLNLAETPAQININLSVSMM